MKARVFLFPRWWPMVNRSTVNSLFGSGWHMIAGPTNAVAILALSRDVAFAILAGTGGWAWR